MIDIEYLLFLQNIRLSVPDFVSQFFVFISYFGTDFSLPILCYVYWCSKKEDGILAFWSMGFAMLANGLIKQIACVYRPWIRDARIVPPSSILKEATGYSFPSGHVTKATSYLGALAWQNHKRAIIFYGLFAITFLVCFSRNFLGVHTPQDVIVGFICGILSIPLAWFVLKWEQNGKNRDFMILGVSIPIVAVYLAYIAFKSYPLDYDSNGKLLVDPHIMALDSWSYAGSFIGLIISWLLEKRLLKFQISSHSLISLCRFVVGFGAVFCLHKSKGFFSSLFTDSWGYFTSSFVTAFFIIFLYPAMFSAIEKCFIKNNPADKQPQV